MPVILIVEDMKLLRDLLCDLLSAYECHAVRSAEEALALLARDHFDLVITDVKLPGISGTELLRTLRVLSPGTPVIVIAGGDAVLRGRDFIDMGAKAYLQKPFTIEEVEAAVAHALRAADCGG